MPAETLPKPAPVPVPVPSATNPPAGLPLLPPPSSDGPAATKPNGKYVVVKTTEKAGNKLFEGAVIVAGEKAIIRQGSFDRTVAKADLVYIAETKDEVYQHLLSKVPAKDVPARLGLRLSIQVLTPGSAPTGCKAGSSRARARSGHACR